MRILVVDDNEDMLYLIKRFVEIHFEEVVTTTSSQKAALLLLDDHSFDGIISDYSLPDMNGLELLQLIRKRGSGIPFILFTGRGREEVAIEALNLGADRYFKKGRNMRILCNEISHNLKQLIQFNRTQAERNTLQEFIFQQNKRLKEAEARLTTFIESATDILIIFDSELLLTHINRSGVLTLFGNVKKDELIGKSLLELFGPTEEKRLGEYNDVLKTGLPLFLTDVPHPMMPEKMKLTVSIFKADNDLGMVITDVQETIDDDYPTMFVPLESSDPNIQMSEFAHQIAHDLRSYIFAIDGCVTLLELENNKKYLNTIKTAIEQMDLLLDGAIDLADAGLSPQKMVTINLASIIQNITLLLPEGVTINYTEDINTHISGNQTSITQLFKNIIDNAIQHGKATEIKIHCSTYDQTTEILITNNGQPIQPKNISKIFRQGYSAKEGGGTGLGLSIAKKIAHSHGWTIDLTNYDPVIFRLAVVRKKIV